MFSHCYTNYKDIGLMDIIIKSKHVFYKLLTAVKKGFQVKTDFMSHTMSVWL